jgi:toxin ParE1/3/4
VKFRIVVRPNAEADLRAVKQWYEERREALGLEFITLVRAAIRGLRDNPERYPVYYRGFRRVLLRRFPYKIFYRIERDRVIIFRVLHASQDHTRYLGAE